MGFLNHLTAILFLTCAVAVAAFAVAVNKFPSAHDLYENHIKEKMNDAEHIFTWIGVIYFVLPMIAFTFVRDWTRTFFDCFTPLTLWSDALYSGIMIVQLIAFIGDIEENIGRIAIEYGGLVVQLACCFSYVMLKQSNDMNFDRSRAIYQNILALVFLLAFGFATLHQLQFKYVVPEGYENLAWSLAAFGIFFQALQPLSSLCFRALEGNFRNDETATRNIKLLAALLRTITLAYDVCLYLSKGYWDSPCRKPLATMACASLPFSGLVLLLRYVGPETLKSLYDAAIDWIKEKCTAIKEWIKSRAAAIKEWWIDLKDRMKEKYTAIMDWIKSRPAAIEESLIDLWLWLMGWRPVEDLAADQRGNEAVAGLAVGQRGNEAVADLAADQHGNMAAAVHPKRDEAMALEQHFQTLTIEEPTSLEEGFSAIRIE